MTYPSHHDAKGKCAVHRLVPSTEMVIAELANVVKREINLRCEYAFCPMADQRPAGQRVIAFGTSRFMLLSGCVHTIEPWAFVETIQPRANATRPEHHDTSHDRVDDRTGGNGSLDGQHGPLFRAGRH